ncbi:MAG TPA: hypothetical protein VGR67_10325 [Candidatus Polarisedimenticolia bacterium]|jgi:hypothetical protein|nr:hypothetical protein [Candidatus Polarisedimenticolia bacterium]
MRIGSLLLLGAFALGTAARAAGEEGSSKSAEARRPRGPYLLRQIFGDQPRSAPEVFGIVPGIRRADLPAGLDLGKEAAEAGSPTAFVKEISGRATVSFVFAGRDAEARLDHITVTVMQAPHITSKSILLHLTKIYGPQDSGLAESPEILGSWQHGTILLRHFASDSFFEMTLLSPAPPARSGSGAAPSTERRPP